MNSQRVLDAKIAARALNLALYATHEWGERGTRLFLAQLHGTILTTNPETVDIGRWLKTLIDTQEHFNNQHPSRKMRTTWPWIEAMSSWIEDAKEEAKL